MNFQRWVGKWKIYLSLAAVALLFIGVFAVLIGSDSIELLGIVIAVSGLILGVITAIKQSRQSRIAIAPKISVRVKSVEVFNNRGRPQGTRESINLYNSGEDAHNVQCDIIVNGKKSAKSLSTLHKDEAKEICKMMETNLKAKQIELHVKFEDVGKNQYNAHFSKEAGKNPFKTISTGL